MYTWIFVCGFICFYNAWGGGADWRLCFVGSKVLTLKQAITASLFTGAVLMGSHVTDTVRKIVSENIFNDDPCLYTLGMLCADLASG